MPALSQLSYAPDRNDFPGEGPPAQLDVQGEHPVGVLPDEIAPSGHIVAH